MKLAGKTDIGCTRSENQDDYRAARLPEGDAWGVVCDGMGASIIADTIIRAMGVQPDVVLYKLDHPQARRDVAIYTRKVSYVTRTMDTFIQILRNREQ